MFKCRVFKSRCSQLSPSGSVHSKCQRSRCNKKDTWKKLHQQNWDGFRRWRDPNQTASSSQCPFPPPVDSPDGYHIRQQPLLTAGDKSGVRLLLRFSGTRKNSTRDGNFTRAEILTHSCDQTLLMVQTDLFRAADIHLLCIQSWWC